MFLFGGGSVRTRLLLVSLVLLGTGIWMILPTWKAGQQETVTVHGLYQGQKPQSTWVKVHGLLLWEEAAIEENKYGSTTAFFVPLVPETWESGDPVRVFVRISKGNADALDDAATIEGLVQPLGLPLDLRMIFDAEGPQPASDALYIHHGTNPHMQRKFAQVVIGIGIAGISVFFVLGRLGQEEEGTVYQSRAQARALGENSRKDPAAEAKRREQESERETAINQWMRERGLKRDEPASSHEPAEANPVAAG
jgi:hypothetical protein